MAEYYWTSWKKSRNSLNRNRSRNSLNRNRKRKRRDTPAPPGDSYARKNWTLMCRRIKMEKSELLHLWRHFWFLMDILVVWRELRLDRSDINLDFPMFFFSAATTLKSRNNWSTTRCWKLYGIYHWKDSITRWFKNDRRNDKYDKFSVRIFQTVKEFHKSNTFFNCYITSVIY